MSYLFVSRADGASPCVHILQQSNMKKMIHSITI